MSAVLVAGLYPLFWCLDCIRCFGCGTISAVLVAGLYPLFWLRNCIRCFGCGLSVFGCGTVSAQLLKLFLLSLLIPPSHRFGGGTISTVLVAGLYPLFWWQDCICCFGCGTISAVLVAGLYSLFWLWDCIRYFGYGTVSALLVAELYPLFWWRDCVRCFGGGTVSAVFAGSSFCVDSAGPKVAPGLLGTAADCPAVSNHFVVLTNSACSTGLCCFRRPCYQVLLLAGAQLSQLVLFLVWPTFQPSPLENSVALVIFIELAWSSRAWVADPLPLRLSVPRWAWLRPLGLPAPSSTATGFLYSSGHVPLARPSSQGICFV